MGYEKPNISDVKRLSDQLGFHLADNEIQEFHAMLEPTFAAYDAVDSAPDFVPVVRYPNRKWSEPDASQNALNAWYVKTEIEAAHDGPLSGRSVVIKDNVAIADVPMMNGASLLEGFRPAFDATVVERVLDAGASVAGKAHCEFFCASGGSHTNSHGYVDNPHRDGFSAGGSSSGVAALVASGAADMGIGGDQGGSIRVPSSFCGLYGLKPTFGLVPYTGAASVERTVDHLGPMTTSVADNALLLEIIAGDDGLDPRQRNVRMSKYTEALGQDIDGIRIGVIEEGFGLPSSETEVDNSVNSALTVLEGLGAKVERLSLPMHPFGFAVWLPVSVEGAISSAVHNGGSGLGAKGVYDIGLHALQARNMRGMADAIPANLKLLMLVGEYMLEHKQGLYYAKAQNLTRQLIEMYDQALSRYEVLILPTTPMKAPPLPDQDAGAAAVVQAAISPLTNTAVFNATGHPATSVPCGVSDGLPIGLQIVGRHFDEATIYRVADAFARSCDWKEMKV